MIETTKGYMDIECYHSIPGKMPDSSKDQITCICLGDSYSGFVSLILDDADIAFREGELLAVRHISNEKNLLKDLIQLLEYASYDIISLWNAPFDVDYIEARCKQHGIFDDWKQATDGTDLNDLLPMYRKLYSRRSYRLKDVALEEGFATELEPQVDYGKMWEEDKPALVERNRRHAMWLDQLDNKLKVVDYYVRLKEIAGLEDISGTLHNSVLLDTMFLRRAFAVLPSKEEHKHEPFEGAYVMQPKAGVHTQVAVLDVSRFYPNIIKSERLDPIILHEYLKWKESKPGMVIDWSEYASFSTEYLSKGKPTLIIDLVNELIALRNEVQKQGDASRLAACKGLTNSIFGVLAHSNCRIYTPEIPARIAEVARVVINKMKSEVENWGYQVLAVDTDSLFVSVKREDADNLLMRANGYLSTLGDFSLKIEHYCDAILFTGAKKRYAMLEAGEVRAVGFEVRRTDSSNYTRGIQERVMRLMLEGKSAEIVPYLRGMIDGVKSAKLEDIAVSKGLSREVEEYKGVTQSYIKALKESSLEIKAGDSVKMIPAKDKPYGMCVFQDISEIGKIQVDWSEVIRTQIKLKVESLLPLVGLSWSNVQGQERLI